MKYQFLITLLLVSFLTRAQSSLIINTNINLPKDSTVRKTLISSLNNFLVSAQKPNEENKLILTSEKVETFILLDEMKGIEKSAKFNSDWFFKPYLTNIAPLKDGKYLVQLSYLGVNENTPILRASFTFIAHKAAGSYLFSSPLLRNTTNWKIEKMGNNIFHYQSILNKSRVREFGKLTSLFDKKLKAENKSVEFYCTNSMADVQKLIGIEYKADFNGRGEGTLSSAFANKNVIVLGDNNAAFDNFDPHDLWHDRLSLVVARSLVNKPVDEGCAYLYGGSWGLDWKEIFKQFKEKVANNKDANWTEYKETPFYFKTNNFNNSADYVVNALIVQKIEREKGFTGVWEFLNCGKFEKGNDNYYRALEKLTGIKKPDYNQKVWELINDEK